MNNRTSLSLLPIAIAVIAFMAFSVWIWLSFEEEKAIFGERLEAAADQLAAPFELLLADMAAALDHLTHTTAPATEQSGERLLAGGAARLAPVVRVLDAEAHLVGAAANREVPAPLADAMVAAQADGGPVLSRPYEGWGRREAALVAVQRDEAGQALRYVAVAFSIEQLRRWWATFPLPDDIGVAVLAEDGASWLAPTDPAGGAEAPAVGARLAERIAPLAGTEGRLEITNLFGPSRSAVVGWERIEPFDLRLAAVASKSEIRGQWAQHYSALLLPSVVATALVVLLVHWIGRSVVREQVRREQVTADLQRSEYEAATARQQLMDAVESMSDGFVLFDKQDRLVLCNQKYRELLSDVADLLQPGVQFEALCRALAERGALVDVEPDDVEEWVADHVALHRRAGAAHEQRLRDGRWVLSKDYHTRTGGTVGIRSDITAYRQALDEIHRLSARNEMILNAAGEGIFGLDLEGRFTFINPAGARMAGYAPDELIGKSSHALIHPNSADGSGHPSAECPIYAAFTGGETREGADETFWRRDGTSFPVEFVSSPIRENGAVRGAVVVFRDVTERRAAEEALRTHAQFQKVLLDTIPLPIFYKDAEGRYLGCNRSFEEIMGRPAEKIVGLTGHDLAPADLAETYERADRQLLRDGGTQSYESPVRFADGRRHTVIFSKATFSRADGSTGGIVGAMLDITERKTAERALREAMLAAETASRTKTEFLANMSHELRTPLNAIIGFSDILAGETFGPMGRPEYLEYARDINESGRHLLELINDILDVSRIEAGKFALQETTVDVRLLLSTCQRMVRERAHENGIELEITSDEGMPGLVADERRLKQILLNLLGNAIKFTPSGGHVSLHAGADRNGAVVFVIRDTGIGIAEEDIEKALSAFGQADSSLARAYEGAGLGLPLAKRLAELHGGELTLESTLGQGTTVSVRLPASRSVLAA